MTYSLESIAQLDHSKEFAALHQKFHQFNPLKVLRVDQFEIRHSNVLAWLLDPSENHKLGSFFVSKLLSRLVTRVENEDKTENFQFLDYLDHSYGNVEVYREVKTTTGRYIDLVVVDTTQKLVLVIENKFHTGESLGQLDDYITYARSIYVNYTIVPVFLTLNSDAPSHKDFWVLDYSDILEMLSLHLELNHEAIPDNVYSFLLNYTEILREELILDETSIQLAVDVYEKNQAAIDLLYLSQHEENRKYSRYSQVFQQLDSISENYRHALLRIYLKQKKTIDYIYKIGSNLLKEAFLTFAKIEEIPEEVYKAHVRVPNFILPDWTDFEETIGRPEDGYWLGSGFIIWFERTWNEKLKMIVEVGPVPDEKRIALLNALESEGFFIRSSSKMEGKKYTRIYNQVTDIPDWATKTEIVKGMERLYQDPLTKSTFKMIASAVEKMKLGSLYSKADEELETEIIRSSIPREEIPKEAFTKFTETLALQKGEFLMKLRQHSFILPIFRDLERTYGKTREKWWWHDSTFVFWFDRLNDDRLKLTLELGPLQFDNRLKLLEDLEQLGVSFLQKSKLPSAKYTRLYSQSKVILNWEDKSEVYISMMELYNNSKFQEVLNMLNIIKKNVAELEPLV
ncbi:PD-(D/E)XK nuclease family protein [Fictibacillus sp. WQ 8-8]|uniref:PDDEXK-like family protein n=1 Tax=Fictibacillus sp. WQ 8-8 TaxID=2938788 RepID=UPI00210ECFB3|nr:PD-(D/E)XK nuclease family protein [Fictibacillus sp. WQ 8-8]MCQ6265126.1 PD-(D/E)XK nuclease family protein [Fictibacillus sp. WQ 8-8]